MAKKNETTPVVNDETTPVDQFRLQDPSLSELDQLKQMEKDLKEKIKAAKAAAKGVKAVKEAKGEMIRFTNKAGETIQGKGVLYYVVRHGGRLHYKESTAVEKMTPEEIEAWKASQVKTDITA